MTRKNKLIIDIQNLLNNYNSLDNTSINPALLEFMDEETLLTIISDLLHQKEAQKELDREWLYQFKKNM